jgi:hypothetical protein
MTGARFYVRRADSSIVSPVVFRDRRGRRREWACVADVVRDLRAAGEDLAGWQIMAGEDSGAGFYLWRGVPGTVADACDD